MNIYSIDFLFSSSLLKVFLTVWMRKFLGVTWKPFCNNEENLNLNKISYYIECDLYNLRIIADIAVNAFSHNSPKATALSTAGWM